MKRNKMHAELFRLTLRWHDKLDCHGPALWHCSPPGVGQQQPSLGISGNGLVGHSHDLQFHATVLGAAAFIAVGCNRLVGAHALRD